LLWGEGIGNIIRGGEPDDLNLFGGMREFGDFLDEGWCGGGVVEDEGEVGFEVEEFGFELGDVVDLGDGLGVEVVVNAVAEFLGEFGGGVMVECDDVEDDGVGSI
jgi:hypothetical protein